MSAVIGTGSNLNAALGMENGITVIGAGSRFQTTYGLTVGDFGTGNKVVVQSGGVVLAEAVSLGISFGGNANYGIVSGAGSRLEAVSSLDIGVSGSNNTFSISDGGLVVSDYVRVGSGNNTRPAAGSSNTLSISGEGSKLDVNGSIDIGYLGSNNILSISNGGVIASDYITIGYGDQSNPNLGSSNNVVVSGAGSILNVDRKFVLGSLASDSSFRIVDGGAGILGSFAVGFGDTSSSALGNRNTVVVSGITAKLSVSSDLDVGHFGSANVVRIDDGSVVDSDILNIGTGDLTNSALGSNNTVIVSGSSSRLDSSRDFEMGTYGSNNKFNILDGGALTVGSATIGSGSKDSPSLGSNNEVLVSGIESELSISDGGLEIGGYGSGNLVTVEQGGTMLVSGNIGIGVSVSATNNMLIVSGSSSRVIQNATGSINLGGQSGNSVEITDGAVMATGGVRVTGHNNEMLVSGFSSIWAIEGGLQIGDEGSSNNMLTVENGALFSFDGNFYIGGTDEYVRLYGGYFALSGNRETDIISNDISTSVFQFRNDGGEWEVAGIDDLAVRYFETNEEAFAFTGYDGLGGYTIVSNVPEPSSTVLIGGALAALMAIQNRRLLSRSAKKGFGAKGA